MDTFDVAKSKEERMKRLQARKRDRGGIFEAPTHNPLLDILLGNFSKTPDDKAKDTLLGTKSTRSKKTKQSKNAKGKHGTNDTALTGAEGTTRKVETARFSPPPQANGSPGGTEDEECTSKQDTKCSKRPRSKTAKVSTDAISATSKKRRDKDEPLDPTRESDSRPLKRQKAAQEKPTTKQNAKAISRSKPVKAKQAALPKEEDVQPRDGQRVRVTQYHSAEPDPARRSVITSSNDQARTESFSEADDEGLMPGGSKTSKNPEGTGKLRLGSTTAIGQDKATRPPKGKTTSRSQSTAMKENGTKPKKKATVKTSKPAARQPFKARKNRLSSPPPPDSEPDPIDFLT